MKLSTFANIILLLICCSATHCQIKQFVKNAVYSDSTCSSASEISYTMNPALSPEQCYTNPCETSTSNTWTKRSCIYVDTQTLNTVRPGWAGTAPCVFGEGSQNWRSGRFNACTPISDDSSFSYAQVDSTGFKFIAYNDSNCGVPVVEQLYTCNQCVNSSIWGESIKATCDVLPPTTVPPPMYPPTEATFIYKDQNCNGSPIGVSMSSNELVSLTCPAQSKAGCQPLGGVYFKVTCIWTGDIFKDLPANWTIIKFYDLSQNQSCDPMTLTDAWAGEPETCLTDSGTTLSFGVGPCNASHGEAYYANNLGCDSMTTLYPPTTCSTTNPRFEDKYVVTYCRVPSSEPVAATPTLAPTRTPSTVKQSIGNRPQASVLFYGWAIAVFSFLLH